MADLALVHYISSDQDRTYDKASSLAREMTL